MPDDIEDFVAALSPVMCDAGDPPACRAGPRTGVVHLTDDRMLGTVDLRERRHCRADTVATAVHAHRFEHARRVG